MDRAEYETWFDMVERMLQRLVSLQVAIECDVNCRDPRYAVENEEVRALDLLGFRLLRYRLPLKTASDLWHVHGGTECSSIRRSITRLQANRDTLQMVLRLYGG